MKRFNLRRMVAHGRIMNFKDYAGRMTAEAYVAQVVAGQLQDPALTAHRRPATGSRGATWTCSRTTPA